MAERPQQMLMRVSVGIHGKDIDAAIEVSRNSGYLMTDYLVDSSVLSYLAIKINSSGP